MTGYSVPLVHIFKIGLYGKINRTKAHDYVDLRYLVTCDNYFCGFCPLRFVFIIVMIPLSTKLKFYFAVRTTVYQC